MQRYDIRTVLVIDLEATCWEDDPPPGQRNEIIEIGSALLSTADGQILRGPELLVRPVSSVIGKFCTELTGITTEMVEERGIPFAEAIDALEKSYGDSRIAWASFGDYDRYMLTNACNAHGIRYPLSDTHINVKRIEAILGGRKETGMMRCLARLGLRPAEGTQHHRGGDDAVNIAQILWEIIRRYRSSTANG
jgi:inhibitor of KinA sporulation pathway (predicted exonuclease)